MATLVRPFSAVAHKAALLVSASICSGSTNSKSLAPPTASTVSSSGYGGSFCNFRGDSLRGSSASCFYGQSGRLFGLRSGVALRPTRLAGEGGARSMFTGLVEEMGNVKDVRVLEDGGFEMTIEADVVLENVSLGDSIAVNGTCLTVTRFDSSSFTIGLAPETLRKTSLGECSSGSPVNLERSLLPSTRLGGHFVQGHVDGTGTIADFRPENDSLWVTIKTTPEILKYIVPKGYIAVDGTSLTVVDVLDNESSFTFMLVAYTQQKVVLSGKKVGAKVNLEVDILGKYVERMLQGYKTPVAAV